MVVGGDARSRYGVGSLARGAEVRIVASGMHAIAGGSDLSSNVANDHSERVIEPELFLARPSATQMRRLGHPVFFFPLRSSRP